jgi:outer membrane biosynthesis protein TonB
MKPTISAALLAMLVATPAYALQEPDKDKEKPQQEEPKKEEPKKEEPRKQEPERQQPQEKEKQQEDKAQADKARQTDKQQQQVEKDRAKQDKPAQDRAQPAQRDEHNNAAPAQRGGGNRHTIKQEDFRAHFGREHSFRVARRDDRRFNYGGYWFVYNDRWPAGWSYSDEVYVDEIDGQYYLIDPVHPGFQLLVVVSD